MNAPIRLDAVAPTPPSFEAMLNGLMDPVLLLDATGTILWSNSAADITDAQNARDLFADFTVDLHLVSASMQMRLTAGEQAYDARLNRLDRDHFILNLHPASLVATPVDLDELTGAAKRNALLAAIDEEVVNAAQQCAVLCLDLDRFKIVNDTLGHGVGDLLLQKVADRLRSVCRNTDLVGRIGGDEFVVLQRNIAAPQDAERLAARIVDLVSRTYVLEGHTVNIGASVGVAFGSAGKQARDILRDADLALYEAKRAGRGRYRLFEHEMSVSLKMRRELEIDLRRALALRQFEVHYQPFVELESDNVRGFEALLRWHHPQRGTVPPLSFIPMAEETGLIVKIGEWVLRNACDAAASWPGGLTVAVNVSPLQFRADNLLETVRSALNNSGLPASQLELEITEGALLDDTDNVLTTLHALRALGVKISMDDFGTGYSSLSYLQKFPFDKIKIDRSFVSGDNPDSQAILQAVAGLGSSLGMQITAEGVETSDQLQHIRDHRCTHVQGYFTGRPMSGGSVLDFLNSNKEGRSNV